LHPEAPLDETSSSDVTRLLRAWSQGDAAAMDELAPKVYDELRRMARKYMRRERADSTLQATALVNEVYLRMVDVEQVNFNDRAHFFAVSAQMMRRILVDRARARGSAKRGGNAPRVDLDATPEIAATGRDRDIVAVDEALDELAKLDPRKAKVIELRYFAGLSVEETGAVLKVSPQTVLRDWKLAKAWLMRELTRGSAGV